MAASRQFLEKVTDITECPICTGTIRHPKTLPCIHSFCLKCLDQYGKGQQPGHTVPCPLCRSEFTVPDGGYSSLPDNFFIEKLLEAQKSSTEEQKRNCCEKHPEKNIEIYCLDCRVSGCVSCFIQDHQSHKCSDVNNVSEEIKTQITADMEIIDKLLEAVDEQSDYLEVRYETAISKNVDETKKVILQRADEIKELVDKHVNLLLEELVSQKLKKLQRIENIKRELKSRKVILERFKKYSLEMIEKAVPSDVAGVAKVLSSRANELRDHSVIEIGRQIEFPFVPTDLSLITVNDGANIVGKVCDSYEETTKLEKVIPMFGETSEDEEKDECSASRSFLTNANPRLINTVLLDRRVFGVTVMGKDIYIIQESSPEIKVYSTDKLFFQSSILMSGLNTSRICPHDIISSNNVLYISDHKNFSIYRVQLPDKLIANWSVGRDFFSIESLSFSSQGNILVLSNAPDKLIEYTTTGNLVREIDLPIFSPLHVIQKSNDEILICQGSSFPLQMHRVCLFESDGQTLSKSYGELRGSRTGQLDRPTHIAVDKHGYVLVADYNNGRVTLLNPELEYVKEFLAKSSGLKTPFRLHLDEEHGRLYIADYGRDSVLIFDIS